MGNDLRSQPNASKSDRTNKPLVVECDYNTKRHNLTFDSARLCSCDELRAKVKESFKLYTRPFKIWYDDDGEQCHILDEGTLDEAIQYYHSSDGSSVTCLSKSLSNTMGLATPMLLRWSEEKQTWLKDTGIPSSMQSFLAFTLATRRCGNSTLNGLRWKPPSHLSVASSESPASSIDDGASGRALLNGSTGKRGSHSAGRGNAPPGRLELLKREERRNPSLSREHALLQTAWGRTWLQKSSCAVDAPSGSLSDSFSLNTDSPMSDAGLSDPPKVASAETIMQVPDPHKTPTSRAAAAAAAKGKGRNREASTSPTILGRSLGSPGSSSSLPSARTGYELCVTCFERVGIVHSWSSCVRGSFSTEKELDIARRSPPKQEGLLRHAFVEQFWDSHCWADLEQDLPRECSIPPDNETEDDSDSQHHDQDFADLRPTNGTEENFIHTEVCNSCEEIIVGARYQCLSCPSKPTAYNLCSDCEVKSYIVHDPMHTFIKLSRPVDIPGPLASEFAFIPIVYQSPAGPAHGSPQSKDSNPAAYLRNLKHTVVKCDVHKVNIVGKWYRCAFCARDLCADCEEVDAHDPTHAFLMLKAPVDIKAFRKPGSTPLLNGDIYHAQR
ncbi:hypothetical protein EI94DRAFT_1808526 [Lactarius quietus]|nr:hypothetical protein EI94DRAFT_1808526 [Lactarius quietus]